ncbi:MAG: N-acetylmuramoyl-L-alanine amidase [Gammaproteobacteria bacterium]|nr:N-acetylmuramoyl-L-alanine amidase [Gammaproteobacteria bacterium]
MVRLILSGVVALVGLLPLLAGAAQVRDVRVWEAPTHTRVVLDLSGATEYKAFPLRAPNRLVLDLAGTGAVAGLGQSVKPGELVTALRHAPRGGGLRLVLDLSQKIDYETFLLPPAEQYGHRLVIDLNKPGSTLSPRAASQGQASGTSITRAVPTKKDFVVVLDPGHGGEDPGANGPRGTQEKRVVLEIARRLKQKIDAEPGMRAELTRSGDYFLSLRQRIAKARALDADLFVSIHADAFKSPKAHGSSVYVVSQRGATSEAARWLAAKENASDLIGGVSLDDKDDVVRSVLIDLAQNATIEDSLTLGQHLVSSLKGVGPLHKSTVQQAGFVVLKSPDIPSVLVETAFISNPEEERKLRSGGHQTLLASALLDGIRRYRHELPQFSTLAESDGETPGQTPGPSRIKHVVSRGDTLSALAQRYNVSLAVLRRNNPGSSRLLRVGDVLIIPERRDG